MTEEERKKAGLAFSFNRGKRSENVLKCLSKEVKINPICGEKKGEESSADVEKGTTSDLAKR